MVLKSTPPEKKAKLPPALAKSFYPIEEFTYQLTGSKANNLKYL